MLRYLHARIICRWYQRQRLCSWAQWFSNCIFRLCQIAILVGVLSLAAFLLTSNQEERKDITGYKPLCKVNFEPRQVTAWNVEPKLPLCPPTGIPLVGHTRYTIYIKYTDIVWSHNLSCFYKIDSNWIPLWKRTRIKCNLVQVKCLQNNQVVYHDIIPIIPIKEQILHSDDQALNVLTITMRGVSRNSFQSYMPRTRQLFENRQGIMFRNFLSKGRYFGDNMLSLMRNCSSWKAPCRRDSSFLWEEFQTEGYYTIYLEDSLNDAIFSRKLPGLDYQWTDNTIIEKFGNTWLNDRPQCIGSRTYHQVLQKLILDSFQSHRRIFIWLNLSFGETKADLPALDTFISNLLLSIEPYDLKELAVLLVSDQGRTVGQYDEVLNDYMHRMNPIAYLMLPTNFSTEYPQIKEEINLLQSRLISHNTLHDLLYTFMYLRNAAGHLKSTVNMCPRNDSIRGWTCPDGIEEELCPCQHTIIHRKSAVVQRLVDYVLRQINRYFEDHAPQCQNLALTQILNAAYMESLRVYKIRFKVSVHGVYQMEDLFETYIQVIQRRPRYWKCYRLTTESRKRCQEQMDIYSAMRPFCYC